MKKPIPTPLVFSRILLAYDESMGSQIALEYACALARAGATLTIAHAIDESKIIASTTVVGTLANAGSTIVQGAIDACAKRAVVADRVVLRDSAAANIVALQRARDFDLIVVGTHGRHGLPRAVLGSVAEDVLRSSDVPVLVVTGYARSPRRDIPFSRALVALDETDPSRTAMSVAALLAQEMSMHLTLCNVIDSREFLKKAAAYGYDERPFETSMHAASLKLLENFANASNMAAPIDDLVVAEGEPAVEIENVALQRNCDLIIIGSHARHGLERLFLGSVAEAVVRDSSLPVLVSPASLQVTGLTSGQIFQ